MWDAGEWMGSAAVHVFIPRQPVWSAWRQSTRIGLGRYGTLHCSSFPSRTASPVSYKIEASVLWELKIILAHHFPISLTLSSFLSGKTLHNTEHPISHGSWQAFSGLQLLRCPLQLSSSPCHPQLCSWEQGSVKSCTPCCPSTATRFLTSHKNPRAKLLDICCVLSVVALSSPAEVFSPITFSEEYCWSICVHTWLTAGMWRVLLGTSSTKCLGKSWAVSMPELARWPHTLQRTSSPSTPLLLILVMHVVVGTF